MSDRRIWTVVAVAAVAIALGHLSGRVMSRRDSASSAPGDGDTIIAIGDANSRTEVGRTLRYEGRVLQFHDTLGSLVVRNAGTTPATLIVVETEKPLRPHGGRIAVAGAAGELAELLPGESREVEFRIHAGAFPGEQKLPLHLRYRMGGEMHDDSRVVKCDVQPCLFAEPSYVGFYGVVSGQEYVREVRIDQAVDAKPIIFHPPDSSAPERLRAELRVAEEERRHRDMTTGQQELSTVETRYVLRITLVPDAIERLQQEYVRLTPVDNRYPCLVVPVMYSNLPGTESGTPSVISTSVTHAP